MSDKLIDQIYDHVQRALNDVHKIKGSSENQDLAVLLIRVRDDVQERLDSHNSDNNIRKTRHTITFLDDGKFDLLNHPSYGTAARVVLGRSIDRATVLELADNRYALQDESRKIESTAWNTWGDGEFHKHTSDMPSGTVPDYYDVVVMGDETMYCDIDRLNADQVEDAIQLATEIYKL